MVVQLLGRERESAVLDGLLRDVRDGRSGVLVLRGEAGAGKSALLDELAGRAGRLRVVRAAGVEAESEFAYSALQRLCAPLLDGPDGPDGPGGLGGLGGLPPVQREALRVAFGLSAGAAPEMLLVGMAVLGLFAEAAAAGPLVCLVDDAQWLDLMSQRILAFVGRRLDRESVLLVFAERTVDGAGDGGFAGLPELPLPGLGDAEARALLERALPGPVDARVRDRIVGEAGGNPLALLELPRGLSPAELAFGLGGPGSGPPPARVEEGFRRRVEALPADSRALLLVAALEPVGDGPLLWHALRLLGVGPEAAAPAEAAGLIVLGAPVRFRHPLVRSAVWRAAAPDALRAAHRALAGATDGGRDPDRLAWHLAHAAAGPDERVAVALEDSADRALARGGRAAAAGFLERAAALSPEPKGQARRALAAAAAHLSAGSTARVPDLLAAAELGPLDLLQQAHVHRLRARAAALTGRGSAAVRPLLDAVRRLDGLDPAAARETCLTAFGTAVRAGRSDPGALRLVAAAADALPSGDEPAGVLLRALAGWSTDGPAAAQPLLARALAARPEVEDPALLGAVVDAAAELGDLGAWLDVTDRAVRSARATGALSTLAAALPHRAAALGFAGRFAEGRALLAGAAAVGGGADGAGDADRAAVSVLLDAYQGRERPVLAAAERFSAAASAGERGPGGPGRLVAVAALARAVLHNGQGAYAAALEAAVEGAAYRDLGVYHWTCGELVEAAVRAGRPESAAGAREELAGWARAGTPWALGAGALAEALAGEPERAEERYREAVDRFARGGLGGFEARARLLFGEWLRRQNRRARAREELRAAHGAAVATGMAAFAERARRELLATGETVRRPEAGESVLTPQEARIARLAADGQPNAEIGAQLFLSPRTVEWHLRKVFTKLGVASRRELGGALSGG
ncbi:helix-turn-helix transcriptional regulator [Kitasatospora cineracea]|uniref:Putative ATPase n=1 Tax=Kitasatospora cineracea TaxID=88074 RepID=A0A8G1X8D4_9ACTN|nr:LuxR family transcriptional regulator [Kitasatospora cineracea]ROR35743.1 putative ATPase [Kitasatospora cineracea]